MKRYLLLIATNEEKYNTFRTFAIKLVAISRFEFHKKLMKDQSLATRNGQFGIRKVLLLDISKAEIIRE